MSLQTYYFLDLLQSSLQTVTIYSPLFIRCQARRLDLRKTAKGVKLRSKRRIESYLKTTKMAALAEIQPAIAQVPKWEQNLSTRLICPECKEDPPNLVEEYAAGDMVCGDCGLIVGARIVDTSSEWRTFSNDDQNNDDPSRVGDGPNLLLNGDQLSTEVAMGDGKLSKDLRRAQNRTVNDKNNKILLAAYKQIGAYCDTMTLPASVANHTKTLYKELIEDPSRNVVRSKPMEVVAAGLLFISCREFNQPRGFREIHKITSVSKKEIGKVFKLLSDWRQKNIALNGSTGIETTDNAKTALLARGSHANALRFNSRLGLSATVSHRIEQLATKIDDLGTLAGRAPSTVLGACQWMITGLMNVGTELNAIASINSVSESTIRTAYKYLYDLKEQLIEPSWLEDGISKLENLHAP